jgi:biotin carboxyl carrier protein
MQLTGDAKNPGRPVTVEARGNDEYTVTVGESTFEVSALLADGRLSVLDGVTSQDLTIERRGEAFSVPTDQGRASVKLMDARKFEAMSVLGGGPGVLKPELVSPMAGKIVLVKVAAGDEVAEGETLVIVEAMKMENELRAPTATRIKDVKVAAGDVVKPGDVLLTFDLGE